MSLGNIGENKSAQKEIQIKYLGKSAFPMDKNIACTACDNNPMGIFGVHTLIHEA